MKTLYLFLFGLLLVPSFGRVAVFTNQTPKPVLFTIMYGGVTRNVVTLSEFQTSAPIDINDQGVSVSGYYINVNTPDDVSYAGGPSNPLTVTDGYGDVSVATSTASLGYPVVSVRTATYRSREGNSSATNLEIFYRGIQFGAIVGACALVFRLLKTGTEAAS